MPKLPGNAIPNPLSASKIVPMGRKANDEQSHSQVDTCIICRQDTDETILVWCLRGFLESEWLEDDKQRAAADSPNSDFAHSANPRVRQLAAFCLADLFAYSD
ncbi:hypothetical protein GALMADRAFT_1162469 [Galerina marginata CBS 339.88]|uniref:Uncharacterized protein n=1 Tax=Galerina marginata (strain CBS 339.88) TaxID=685588 RepID=A0A067S660_GALM3|nr:hypothetical protein GALMADRAFT_1162469 [Galerina marginata CBS 339.88]